MNKYLLIFSICFASICEVQNFEHDSIISEMNSFLGYFQKYSGENWEFDDLVVSFYVYLISVDHFDKKEVSRCLDMMKEKLPIQEGEKRTNATKLIDNFADFILQKIN